MFFCTNVGSTSVTGERREMTTTTTWTRRAVVPGRLITTSQLKGVVWRTRLTLAFSHLCGCRRGNKKSKKTTTQTHTQDWLVNVAPGEEKNSWLYLHWIKHLATIPGQVSHKLLEQNKTPRWPLLFSPRPHRATPRATEKLQGKNAKICRHSNWVSGG